ncbi:MAG: 50S ribosomal protein L6 [bacterium]|nr:50S ribosomal protein L6 [bacterium]
MSRIGKIPIKIPSGVEVKLNPGAEVFVKGPKGTATLCYHDHVDVKQDGPALLVFRHGDEKQDRAYHGLYQRLIGNMVKGVTAGFSRELELVGVGYRAAMEGKTLVLSLGYSHEIRFNPPQGITITTPKPTSIVIAGSDKQQVGQVSAEVRAFRPPEPYKGKGIRYSGEHIRRKVGKSGA